MATSALQLLFVYNNGYAKFSTVQVLVLDVPAPHAAVLLARYAPRL